ncbi:hypothetical protein ACWCXX_36285 [Streptomyces sp. NPDC001732]
MIRNQFRKTGGQPLAPEEALLVRSLEAGQTPIGRIADVVLGARFLCCLRFRLAPAFLPLREDSAAGPA